MPYRLLCDASTCACKVFPPIDVATRPQAGGALIGPHALGVIKDVDAVRHLAELGVVFLLFNIGLELSLERLRQMQKYVFGLGSAQVRHERKRKTKKKLHKSAVCCEHQSFILRCSGIWQARTVRGSSRHSASVDCHFDMSFVRGTFLECPEAVGILLNVSCPTGGTFAGTCWGALAYNPLQCVRSPLCQICRGADLYIPLLRNGTHNTFCTCRSTALSPKRWSLPATENIARTRRVPCACQVCATLAVVAYTVMAVTGLSGPASIVLGGGLALSSTAVAMQVLQDRGETGSRHGRATFAVLLFQVGLIHLLLCFP